MAIAAFGTVTEDVISGNVITGTIFDAEVLAASGTATSSAIDLNQFKARGYFGLQYTIAGSGTVKFEYQLSNNGVTFVEPAAAVDIGSSLTAGNGYLSFAPACARYIQIVATETGGANGVTITGVLAVQA